MPPERGFAPPSDNVYVTDLPLGIDDDTVKAIFEMYGHVVQHRALPNSPGQAKSVALVRFDSVETATHVVDTLNGYTPEGLTSPVNVRFAGPPKPRVPRPGPYDPPAAVSPSVSPSAAGKSAGKGSAGAEFDNLYIKHLPSSTDESEVRQVFGQYGSVMQCRVFKYPNTCSALVRFASADEAAWVKDNLQGNVPEGYVSPVEIKFYVPKGKGAEAGERCGAVATWNSCGAGSKGGYYNSVTWGRRADADAWGSNGKAASKGIGKGEFRMKELVVGFEKSGALPGGTGWENNDACLYISGLPADAEDVDLYRLCNPFGAIAPRGVKVMQKPEGGCKGFGFVNFQDVAAAHACISVLNGTILPDDSILTVKVKSEPTKGSGK